MPADAPQNIGTQTKDGATAAVGGGIVVAEHAIVVSSLCSRLAATYPRLLVLAAHPDDETIGAGGLMHGVGAMGAEVGVVHLTDGAPENGVDARAHGFGSPDAYARARAREADRALACLPAGAERFTLGFRDQELSYRLADVAHALARFIDEWRPAIVFTHPYEGGHPDHDAAALAAARVCTRPVSPPLCEFASYHLHDGDIRTGAFLEDDGRSVSLELDSDALGTKRHMLDEFTTQQETLRRFDHRTPERFRAAPRYDFRRPPHAPPVFYDFFGWGITSAGWVRRATELLDAAAPDGHASCR